MSGNIFAFISSNLLLITLMLGLIAALIYTERRRGGLAVNSSGATALINSADTLSIDLRSAEEYNRGHIANCVQMAPSSALASVQEASPDLASPILLVCASGASSRTVAAALKRAGYRNVSLLSGGIRSWQTDNLPLVTAQKPDRPAGAKPKAKKGAGKKRKAPAG